MLLAKSRRASERLLESSTKYLEERLKLTVNREKSRTVSVFAIRNFKFLGFASVSYTHLVGRTNGDMLLKMLEDVGVNTDFVSIVEEETGLSLIHI